MMSALAVQSIILQDLVENVPSSLFEAFFRPVLLRSLCGICSFWSRSASKLSEVRHGSGVSAPTDARDVSNCRARDYQTCGIL